MKLSINDETSRLKSVLLGNAKNIEKTPTIHQTYDPSSIINLKSFAKRLSVELVEVDPEDSIGTGDQLGEFAVNCCPLPGYLIGPTRFRSLKVNQLLKKLDVMHITVPTTQFRLSGGAVHCLTNEL